MPALMLHCGLGTSGMWKPVAARLGDLLDIVAPDLPGHGRSPAFVDGVDVHDQACDAVRPLLTDGIHLVGHSFGATLALRLALEQPGRVATLTLIEPVFFAAARGAPTFDRQRKAEQEIFEQFATRDPLLTARLFNRLWGGGVPWDGFPEKARQDMARQMAFVMGSEPSLWQDRHDMLRPGGLESLTLPVGLIRGGDTVPIIADVHRGLMARLPNATETVVAGAGHMLVTSHADAVADAIRALVADGLTRP